MPDHLPKPGSHPVKNLILILTFVLALLIVLFTFLPPDHILFLDLSGANT